MKIRLTDAEGNVIRMIVPAHSTDGVVNAHTLVYRGISYGYRGLAGGELLFEQRGPDFTLQEEWVV